MTARGMKVLSLDEKSTDEAKWPVDRCLARIDEFGEVLVLAKRRGHESYVRFSSKLKSTFWWAGALDSMMRNLYEESLERIDD